MSREMPYNPMGPRPKVASEAEVQAMLAKLKARQEAPARETQETGAKTSLEPAKTDIPPVARCLEWDKPVRNKDGTGHVKTTNGRYCVCKVQLNGRMTYELWSLLPTWQFQMEVGLESFEKAKEMAETHARKDPTRVAA
jgi:hypothetical protein